jgi:hypothetical protein
MYFFLHYVFKNGTNHAESVFDIEIMWQWKKYKPPGTERIISFPNLRIWIGRIAGYINPRNIKKIFWLVHCYASYCYLCL